MNSQPFLLKTTAQTIKHSTNSQTLILLLSQTRNSPMYQDTCIPHQYGPEGMHLEISNTMGPYMVEEVKSIEKSSLTSYKEA